MYQDQIYASPDPFAAAPAEKRAIKKQFGTTFIFTLIHAAGSFVLAQVFFIIMMAGGYDVQYTEDGTTIVDWAYSLAGSMPSIIVCIMLFLINKSITKEKLSSYLRTDKMNGSFVLATLGVVMFAYAVSMILQLLAISGFELIDLSPISEDYMTEPKNDAAYLAQELLTTVILAPIAEELMFRGVVMSRIAKVSRRLAIFVSAAVFGMMHGNLLQTILGFIVGIVFAYADLQAESLLPSIIGHMFINATPTLTSFVEYFADEDASDTVWALLMISYGIAGLITFLICLCGRKIKFPEFSENHKKRAPIMITCISFWLSMIYFLVDIISKFGPMTDKLRGD